MKKKSENGTTRREFNTGALFAVAAPAVLGGVGNILWTTPSPAATFAGSIKVMNAGSVKIHDYEAPEDGLFVHSVIVEGPTKIVLFDTQFFLAYATEVADYIEGLKKPVERIVISHIHPDHWSGLDVLGKRFPSAPIYALQNVKDYIAENGLKMMTADGQVQSRVQARILSYLNLEKLVEAEGATWLDKELLSRKPEHVVVQGFGEQVSKAITLRRQWLVDNALGSETGQGQFQPTPNLLQQLRQRDLRQARIALSKELGLTHVEPFEGQQITGKFSRTAELASGKYAVIQKAKEFVLVPWQREFENTRSRPISGVAGGQGITWDWSGRKRGLEIS